MKKIMVSTALVMICLLGLTACACHRLPEKVIYSPGLEQRFETLDVPVAVVVTKSGELAAYDENGKILEFCIVPNRDQSNTKDLKPCPGLVGDKKIIFIKNVKITGSKGSPFCVTIEDIMGRAQTYCVNIQ